MLYNSKTKKQIKKYFCLSTTLNIYFTLTFETRNNFKQKLLKCTQYYKKFTLKCLYLDKVCIVFKLATNKFKAKI